MNIKPNYRKYSKVSIKTSSTLSKTFPKNILHFKLSVNTEQRRHCTIHTFTNKLKNRFKYHKSVKYE